VQDEDKKNKNPRGGTRGSRPGWLCHLVQTDGVHWWVLRDPAARKRLHRVFPRQWVHKQGSEYGLCATEVRRTDAGEWIQVLRHY